MQSITQVVDEIIKPLCPQTQQLFSPIHFSENDRLHVSLPDDGSRFLVTATAHGLCYGCGGSKRDEPDFPLFPCPKCEGAGHVERMASNNAANKWATRLPERGRGIKYGQWLIAATDFNALLIHHLWPSEQVTFDADANTFYKFLLSRFLSQSNNGRIKANFLLAEQENSIVSQPYPFIDHPDLPLTPYQKVGLLTSINQEASALFMEQGTGKTPIVISRICNEAYQHKQNGKKNMLRVLIAAPKNVRSNWQNEFMRFATRPGKITILRGDQLERVKLMIEAFQEDGRSEYSVVICSYDSVVRTWEAMKLIEWDLCVLDESHYIKSVATQRFQVIVKLLRDRCRQRMILTGTPITNNLFDLYAQFEFLGEGLSGFTSYKNFQRYYSQYAKRNGTAVVVGYENVPLIQERMARLAFMIRKDQALPELPKKLYTIVECEMSEQQADYYKKVHTRLALEAKQELEAAGPNKYLVINNILTKMLRLAQITSGYVVWDEEYDEEKGGFKEREIDRFDPNPKLEQLVDTIKVLGPNEKVAVWCCWVQNIKQIAARLREEGIDCVTYYGATSDKDRDIAETRFNEDDKCKVFIGNPAAGGTGLNLLGYNWRSDTPGDTNCTTVIYYSQNWSPTARSQSEDRFHRRGTRVPVTYVDLVTPATIDEEIRVRVLGKRKSAYELQDLRDIMKNVLKV